MSGNFVRERQRIVYIYIICKQYVAARARNFQTFLGRLWYHISVSLCTHYYTHIINKLLHGWFVCTIFIIHSL